MAAGSAAKGALHLINWGKKIIPATADEIADFGPQAPRVKALLGMMGNMSDDALSIASKAKAAKNFGQHNQITKVGRTAERNLAIDAAQRAMLVGKDDSDTLSRLMLYMGSGSDNARNAAKAEVVSDLITPQNYRALTNPMAAGRVFDLNVPRTPESFTNIARSLGERGLISSPKEIDVARQISQLSPDMQQVYLNLLGEDTDPVQLLQALRLMGQ